MVQGQYLLFAEIPLQNLLYGALVLAAEHLDELACHFSLELLLAREFAPTGGDKPLMVPRILLETVFILVPS